MVAPERKFAPVRVTGTLEPCTALAGVMEVRLGAAALTVKTAAAVVPPVVVTVTLRAPNVAVAAIDSVAVICVALTTATSLTVTPVEETATVAPETKFVPVRVTGTLTPCGPLVGAMEVRVGGVGIVKTTDPVVPNDVVTVMVRVPGVALEATVKVAVSA